MINLHTHRRGSAILVAMVIVVLLSILAVSFLEKIIRLSKTSGGIESSAQAYTLTTGIIEEQLMGPTMTREQPWNIQNRSELGMGMSSTGGSLIAHTGGSVMPMSGYGNSPFDPNWNLITLGDPVQIVIPSGVNWSNVDFQFRVPNIGNQSSTGAANNSGVILWTFGYSGATLYASGETNIFKGNDINGDPRQIYDFNGFTNTGSSVKFNNFYTGISPQCGSNGAYNCTLKLSMIRPFLTMGGQRLPMLEYKIDFKTPIPSQYMVIDSNAYVRGYLRTRNARIPQITTNTALDFTVLQ